MYRALKYCFEYRVLCLLSLYLLCTLCCLRFPLNLPCLCLFSLGCICKSFRTYSFTWYQSAIVEIHCCRRTDKSIYGENQKRKEWTEEWLARFRLRSSRKAIAHHGRTRCTSTCTSMATGVMSMERMMQHPNRHTKTSRPMNRWRA